MSIGAESFSIALVLQLFGVKRGTPLKLCVSRRKRRKSSVSPPPRREIWRLADLRSLPVWRGKPHSCKDARDCRG